MALTSTTGTMSPLAAWEGREVTLQDRATFSVSFPARNKQIEKTAETYGNTTWRHSSGHFALWAEVVHRQ